MKKKIIVNEIYFYGVPIKKKNKDQQDIFNIENILSDDLLLYIFSFLYPEDLYYVALVIFFFKKKFN